MATTGFTEKEARTYQPYGWQAEAPATPAVATPQPAKSTPRAISVLVAVRVMAVMIHSALVGLAVGSILDGKSAFWISGTLNFIFAVYHALPVIREARTP